MIKLEGIGYIIPERKPELTDELAHYGVKGMKWGVRRYQPYPKGKRGRYVGNKVGYTPLKYKSPAAEEAKQLFKRYSVGVATMLVPGLTLAYGLYLSNERAKYNLDIKDYRKKDGEIEPISKLRKKSTTTTAEQDAKVTNPGSGQYGRVNNCMYCTATMELRRRGYDVQARRRASGCLDSMYSEWFSGVKYKKSSVERADGESRESWVNKSYNKLCESLEKNPNGSRGFVSFGWENAGAGHTMFWEVENGSVKFYDGQTGKTDTNRLFSLADQNYTYARLDNCALKAAVSETCVSRKEKK